MVCKILEQDYKAEQRRVCLELKDNNLIVVSIILLKLMRITDERRKEQSSMKYLGKKYPEFQRAVK